jgi:two-component system, cell cycle sensor histidine kinase and response regulator CckA
MAATILIVDDDDLVRTLLGRVLRGSGYTVLEAGCGEDAESMCRQRTVDLVVSDVCMTGKTGPQLGVSLRQLAPRLPLLFISGYPEAHPQVRGVAEGNAFLSKPFTPERLLSRVRDLLAA